MSEHWQDVVSEQRVATRPGSNHVEDISEQPVRSHRVPADCGLRQSQKNNLEITVGMEQLCVH